MLGLRWWFTNAPPPHVLVSSSPCLVSLAVSPNSSLRRCRCATDLKGGRSIRSVRSPDLVELEYADLNLNNKYATGHLGHLRIRQHVNPLAASFSEPVPIPDWKRVFRDPTLPLMVDIGCGSGRFLIWLAKNSFGSRNYLGLEIRQKLVQRSEFWVKDLALKNIYFMFANAAVSFDQLVSAYPGPLTLVSILCPDPHFKKRHHKRRVVQKPLVDSIAENLSTGGKVHQEACFNPFQAPQPASAAKSDSAGDAAAFESEETSSSDNMYCTLPLPADEVLLLSAVPGGLKFTIRKVKRFSGMKSKSMGVRKLKSS